MSDYLIGYTDKFRITIRKGGALYDPETVQVTFLKGDATEDTLTLGGVSARDGQLTKISTGIYEYWYKYDVVGEWRICERWSDQSGAATVINSMLVVNIKPSPFTWVDH